MKLLLLLLMSTPLWAASFHYDNERSGEGITVSETEAGGLAWILFTHTDDGSYLGGVPIPPVVSPMPPPPIFEPGDGLCEDPVPIWFTGHAVVFVDDIGIGPFYYTHAPEYPLAEDEQLGDNIEVGMFHIEKLADGYSLILESNGVMSDLYIFNVTHEFHESLAE